MPYYTKRNGRKRRVYEKNGKYFVYERVQKFVKRADITEEAGRRSPPKRIGILENQIRELEDQLASTISNCAAQYQQSLSGRGVDPDTIRQQTHLIEQQRRSASELAQLRAQIDDQNEDHRLTLAEKEQELAECTQKERARVSAELRDLRAHLAQREAQFAAIFAAKDQESAQLRGMWQQQIQTIPHDIIAEHQTLIAQQTGALRAQIDALRAQCTSEARECAQHAEDKDEEINLLHEQVERQSTFITKCEVALRGERENSERLKLDHSRQVAQLTARCLKNEELQRQVESQEVQLETMEENIDGFRRGLIAEQDKNEELQKQVKSQEAQLEIAEETIGTCRVRLIAQGDENEELQKQVVQLTATLETTRQDGKRALDAWKSAAASERQNSTPFNTAQLSTLRTTLEASCRDSLERKDKDHQLAIQRFTEENSRLAAELVEAQQTHYAEMQKNRENIAAWDVALRESRTQTTESQAALERTTLTSNELDQKNRQYVAQIAEIRALCDAVNAENQTLKQSISSMTQRMTEIEGTRTGTQKEMRKHLDAALAAIQTGKNAAQQGVDIASAIGTMREVDDRCTRELAECKERLEKSLQSSYACDAALEDYKQKYSVCQGDLTLLKEYADKTYQQNTDLAAQYRKLDDECRGQSQEKEQYLQHEIELLQRIEVLEEEIRTLRASAGFEGNKEREISEIRARVAELESENADLNLEIINLRAQSQRVTFDNEKLGRDLSSIEPRLAECADFETGFRQSEDKARSFQKQLEERTLELQGLDAKLEEKDGHLQCMIKKEKEANVNYYDNCFQESSVSYAFA